MGGDELALTVPSSASGRELINKAKATLNRQDVIKLFVKDRAVKVLETLHQQNIQDGNTLMFVCAGATQAWQERVVKQYEEGQTECWSEDESWQVWDGMQSLSLGHTFNQALEQSLQTVALPAGLQSLSFGDQFFRSLQGVALPTGLQSLSFGYHFDQSLQSVALPAGLQSLSFGECFDQSLQGVALPVGLQSLSFGHNFDQSLQDVALPVGLQSLSFGYRFNQPLQGVALPAGLQSLRFGNKFSQSLEGVHLPAGLQSLCLGSGFDWPLQSVDLPLMLQDLTLRGRTVNLRGVAWPAGLQSLVFDRCFNHGLQGVALPTGLRSLVLGGWYNQSLHGLRSSKGGSQRRTSPKALEQCWKWTGCNRAATSTTQARRGSPAARPGHCGVGRLGPAGCCGMGVDLPAGLESLSFGSSFSHSLEEAVLPAGLKYLKLRKGSYVSFRAPPIVPSGCEVIYY